MFYCPDCDEVYTHPEDVNWGGRNGETPVCPECYTELEVIDDADYEGEEASL